MDQLELDIPEPELIRWEGFEAAELGVCQCWDGHDLVDRIAYSGRMMLDILVAKGSSEDDAYEYLAFNVESAYVGPHTPVIIW